MKKFAETSSEKSKSQQVVLVTGAAGFIGSRLVIRLVQAGWNVHIVVRPTSELPKFPEFMALNKHTHDGSLENMIRIVKAANPFIVVHLASLVDSDYLANDVTRSVESNIVFGIQLLEAMKMQSVSRIVNTGTYWQHYKNRTYSPVSFYAASKQAFECFLRYYTELHGLRSLTLKLYDTYGPGDNRRKILPLLYQASVNRDTLKMSPGDQIIDLVYIDDVIDSFLLAMKRVAISRKGSNKIYGVSSGRPMTLRHIVHILSEVTGRSIPVDWGGRDYRPREIMQPISRLPNIPTWHPKVTIEEGLLRSFSIN